MSLSDRDRLEASLKRVLSPPPGTPIETQAELARFACVLVSAFVEASCREIFVAYARNRCHPFVLRYVDRQLGRFQNPDSEKLLGLTGFFDPASRDALESFMAGKRSDSLNSIVGNRNAIAHGRQSSITLAAVSGYYADVKDVMKHLRALFPPGSPPAARNA